MQTHIVPVGFDYDRLIAPLVRDQIDVDSVILLEGAVGSEANVEYSRHLSEKLETDFRNLLGASTDRFVLEDVYDYDAAFEQAYDLITAELDRGNEVWVNVAAMPRTVSFAFANAAHSLMVERQEDREGIHTYYTAPEKYLETELAEELREQIALLEDVGADGAANEPEAIDDDRLEARLESARDLLSEFDERGTTIGAKEIDGRHIVELPVASFSNVKPFEELILYKLGEDGEFDSVSELAEALARELNEEYTDSFRSKVIYNVDRLGPGGKGYIEREEHGKSYRTRLSRIGELWVRAHSDSEAAVETDEQRD
ncbi:HFX_2341 family transcriptional regulator [Natronorubrum sp. FCH18a]|uniref:HFX_2341 family transcriptional regulator n=1 Tax=Natronorubrum sp. FCH18a TaxID=3447018 RepID=UPI003F50EBCF